MTAAFRWCMGCAAVHPVGVRCIDVVAVPVPKCRHADGAEYPVDPACMVCREAFIPPPGFIEALLAVPAWALDWPELEPAILGDNEEIIPAALWDIEPMEER